MNSTVPYTFELAVLKYPEYVNDLISVIVPIYNTKELYLREALDSIIAQTFENWEAILVNDGSTDEIIEQICAEYAKKDPRFKYVYKDNEGTNLARKTGLEHSRGEFIASLDSDDIFCPQFLEKMFAKIKGGNNDFVFCNFDGLGKIKPPIVIMQKFSENKLENCRNVRNYSSGVANKLIKRSIYAKVLFPNTYIVFGEDLIQNLSILYHSKNVDFVTDRLYIYRTDSITSGSLTFNTISKEKRYIQRVTYTIAAYLIMNQFFGSDEAEKSLADENNFGNFADYFLLDKKTIAHYNIGYAENFMPAFVRGLKKTEGINFKERLRKMALILACKGFPLSFRVLRKMRNILK